MKYKSIVFILILVFAAPLWGKDFVRFQAAREHFSRGLKFYDSMQYLAAVDYFRKAIREYPEYYTARDYLARTYRLAGFTEEALNELSHMEEVFPDNPAIKAKIDTLKYRIMAGDPGLTVSDLVYISQIDASFLRRFGFRRPADIAVDSGKNMYITSFETAKLSVLDLNGKGSRAITPSIGGRLYGVDVMEGKLVVTNFSEDRVFIMSTDGEIQKAFGESGSGPGQFHGPQGVNYGTDKNLYVVDSGNSRVQKFSPDGGYLLHFGKKGEYEGEFKNPTDLCYHKGSVYVTDTGNKIISVFDEHGNYRESLLNGKLSAPRGITAVENKLFISDEEKGLCVYDLKNRTHSWFSSWNNGEMKFVRLISSAVDREGYVHCLDYNKESVYTFAPPHKLHTNLDIEILAVDTEKFPVVALYVTVKDRNGRAVFNLNRRNFSIKEDGAAISNIYTEYLKRMAPSVSIVLCADRSTENQKFHSEMAWASDFILKKMRKNDSVKVINFNKEIWNGSDFDWSRRRTLHALGKREYREGKRFGAVIYDAISDLLFRLNRRAAVVLTDGSAAEDAFTTYSPEILVQYARAHFIPVYFVSFGKADPALEKIASATGGKVIRPSGIDDLRGLYLSVKNSEEYRYVLVYSTYKPASFKGWWSDLTLEANFRAQTGIERGGYFVP